MSNMIKHDDILFATVSQRGTTILSLQLSGLTSIKEILKYLRATITDCMGMVTLKLRNGSQGWTLNQPLLLGDGQMSKCNNEPAIQLTLF